LAIIVILDILALRKQGDQIFELMVWGLFSAMLLKLSTRDAKGPGLLLSREYFCKKLPKKALSLRW